jgi:hypothetical protein
VTQDRKPVMFAQGPADFLELGIGHKDFVAIALRAVFNNADNSLGLPARRAVATAFTSLRLAAFRFLAESR